jgi:peptidoglycan/xylan/chitin deacetylase (PgdA/CDA1 family)
MIGVIADPADHEVVCEFFELFKTPWEFHRRDRHYDVVFCAGDASFDGSAKLLLLYAGKKTRFDGEQEIHAYQQLRSPCVFSYKGERIPVYGDATTFVARGRTLLTDEGSQNCAAYLERVGEMHRARIGYDLFAEVRKLLTVGQPRANADIPTLELHIRFLVDLIKGCGISFVEIPPVPLGYRFAACLTHDVDHPSIRQHKLDHTTVGFLLRAVFGSLVDALLGRIGIRDALRNWAAAVKLPFVHLGVAKDFWRDFDDRYLELERGLPATFFVIPRKNYPGKRATGSAPALRAARYEATELADTICRLTTSGCEVGLHGIDAWLDSSNGHKELEEVRRLTGVAEVGVRMHWLYYDEKSPATLEKAGAAYDSTIGYNETVGYRAGTTQAYKPLGAERLLELPMHAMDTALFYLSYLGLSPTKATARLRQMVDTSVQYGGCITINWHDRSLSPERLWGSCYRELIEDLRSRGAWFATAGQAVSWFRKRRSVKFEEGPIYPSSVQAKISRNCAADLPGLRMRIYNQQNSGETDGCGSAGYVDIAISEGTESPVPLDVRD